MPQFVSVKTWFFGIIHCMSYLREGVNEKNSYYNYFEVHIRMVLNIMFYVSI